MSVHLVVRRGVELVARFFRSGARPCPVYSIRPISRTSEYALRAVSRLIQEPACSHTTRQIAPGHAHATGLHLEVLQLLAKAGLVRGQRGLGGGFQFAGDPAQVTVLEVIKAVDPLERIHTCPVGLKAYGTNLCPLHCGMNDAVAQTEAAFARTKLVELINTDSKSVPLGIKLKPIRRVRVRN